MKQVLQSLANGTTEVIECPAPAVRPYHILIETRCSLISAGTERMLVEFGKGGLISKARKQPERVKDVLKKVKSQGLFETIDAVRSKLNQPLPLGYCNAGVVLAVGEGVTGFAVGDRVASNGPHAEVVCIAQTLCARIPDNVSFAEASFTPLAAIALQGIRLADPKLGERVAVIGLGLIGLMAVQMLKANGCDVLAIDVDDNKLAMASDLGAQTSGVQDAVAAANRLSNGMGFDAVLIAASTASSDPVTQAALMSRKRGRIVLIGVTGLELNRADFYEKELSFQVSCSYGPGRYDTVYESGKTDYPAAFVRWTEQRNFEASLNMMGNGSLKLKNLISHHYTILDAGKAYDTLSTDRSALGIIFDYPEAKSGDLKTKRSISLSMEPSKATACVIGLLGAGNYGTRVLAPNLKLPFVRLHSIVSQSGAAGLVSARNFGFENASSDSNSVINHPDINTIFIATRHDSHASLAAKSLQAGKNVFVEKPLAISESGLEEVLSALSVANGARLMMGFNRRFSPLSVTLKRLCEQRTSAKTLIATINAGAIPANHWTQDTNTGGGRIIGEACHFIDYFRFLVGHPIVDIQTTRLGQTSGEATLDDKATLTLYFADGSHGSIHYFANGAADFPKERIEVFCNGAIAAIDNFKSLKTWSWPGAKSQSLFRMDKGHAQCARAFVEAVRDGAPSPIPLDDIIEVARWTLTAAKFDKR
jgi:predicted dehydrogenase